MLTSGLELIVYVDRRRIIIWRLSASDELLPRDKYMTDSAPADDEDSDVDSYLYDDSTDDSQQVHLSTWHERWFLPLLYSLYKKRWNLEM